ncbi:aminotransferase, partial [Stenotrophomonas sp. SG1]|nr:aminotransferase [Stenotrophomonas sp. SG1]
MDRMRRSLLRAGTLLPAAALSSLPDTAAARYAASMQIPISSAAPDVLARDES